MTSRRQFFGFLAAAPLVAPAVAKEMIGPKYASGFIGEFAFSDWTTLQPMRPLSDGSFVMSMEESEAFMKAINVPSVSFGPIKIPMHEPQQQRIARYGWAIPNRLYGAQINADGDAV